MRYIQTTKSPGTAIRADYKSGIRDWSAQIDFDYNPIPTHHVKFGVQYLHHSFRPEVSTSKIFDKTGETIERDTTYYTTSNSEILAHEASAYLEDNFNLSSRLRMNLGLHFSTFQVQKEKLLLRAAPHLRTLSAQQRCSIESFVYENEPICTLDFIHAFCHAHRLMGTCHQQNSNPCRPIRSR